MVYSFKYSFIIILISCFSAFSGYTQVKEAETISIEVESNDVEKMKAENKESYEVFSKRNAIYNTNESTQQVNDAQRYDAIQKQETMEKGQFVKFKIEKEQEEKARSEVLKHKMLNMQKALQSLQLQQQKAIIISKTPEDSKETKDTLVVIEGNYEYKYNRLKGSTQFDSRLEIAALDPDINWQFFMLLINNSVGMVIEKEKLTKISNEYYQLNINTSLKNKYNLCENVTFSNQASVGVGTAFIIGQDNMLTANHVFQSAPENYAIVFGFEIKNKIGTVEHIIHKSNVYFPIKKDASYSDIDVASFQVDRNFSEDKKPLQLGNSFNLKKDHEIYMIGHPSGLPKKIAVNAGIIDNSHHQFFYTSLDSFQGNSGSPVINFKTNKVIGVLVSGEVDYEFNGQCFKNSSCKIPYCLGEKVIRIETISSRF